MDLVLLHSFKCKKCPLSKISKPLLCFQKFVWQWGGEKKRSKA